MPPSPVRRSARRAAAALVLGLAINLAGPAAPARAETAAEARAAASAAAAEVAALQPRLAQALTDFDLAMQGLATNATRSIRTDEIADTAALGHLRAKRAHVARVRAIYMAGGPATLYGGVLDARSPHDLLARIAAVRRVVGAASEVASGTESAARRSASEASRQERAAVDSVITARDVEARGAQLDALLAAAGQRLDRLSATARHLEEAEAAAAALAALEAARVAAAAAAAARATQTPVKPAPADYASLYRAAALTCPGLPWYVLSAIGQVETGHGRNKNVSSAGARGPMQFMPATFAAYGVDGGGDGRADILDPADSVFSAANYLCANGAGNPATLPRAIWHYNHAQWYVDMVLRIAAQIHAAEPG